MNKQDTNRLTSLYSGLRVSDVSDAMDMCGLFSRGLLDRNIRPLYRDLESFSHRFAGPARTVRYIPTGREVPVMTPEEFRTDFMKFWGTEVSPAFDFKLELHEGDVVVIDAQDQDVGFIGSNNCMRWKSKGAVGVVTNGGARDTDELIIQKCAVYSRFISRTFKPGRLELDGLDIPVNCGGVMVRPGDMIVADGDGVICVPAEHAEQVGILAKEEMEQDKEARRKWYGRLGLPDDITIKE